MCPQIQGVKLMLRYQRERKSVNNSDYIIENSNLHVLLTGPTIMLISCFVLKPFG